MRRNLLLACTDRIYLRTPDIYSHAIGSICINDHSLFTRDGYAAGGGLNSTPALIFLFCPRPPPQRCLFFAPFDFSKLIFQIQARAWLLFIISSARSGVALSFNFNSDGVIFGVIVCWFLPIENRNSNAGIFWKFCLRGKYVVRRKKKKKKSAAFSYKFSLAWHTSGIFRSLHLVFRQRNH